mgnify:FL=1|jgi:hypothetical protein|nr:MAG TPA: transposon-encoded protein [Bacteriophage sp.]
MSEKTKKDPISYSRYGDYLIPSLILDNGKVTPKIGRYGRLRLKFLKEEMKPVYTKMLMDDTLTDYLLEVDARATDMENMLINEMKKYQNIDEKLKEEDQMKWVGAMNMIAYSAREMVLGKCINTYNI